MGNVNVCQLCGYSVDDGMKAFSIVEMFMAIYHLIVATRTHKIYVSRLFELLKEYHNNIGFPLKMVLAFYILFIIALVFQAVFGVLLYVLGFRQRNILICYCWIVISCFTFTFPWLAFIFNLIEEYDSVLEHTTCNSSWWTPFYLYLFYLTPGVWMVSAYMKWTRVSGIAVVFSIAPSSNEPPTEREKLFSIPSTAKKTSNKNAPAQKTIASKQPPQSRRGSGSSVASSVRPAPGGSRV